MATHDGVEVSTLGEDAWDEFEDDWEDDGINAPWGENQGLDIFANQIVFADSISYHKTLMSEGFGYPQTENDAFGSDFYPHKVKFLGNGGCYAGR